MAALSITRKYLRFRWTGATVILNAVNAPWISNVQKIIGHTTPNGVGLNNRAVFTGSFGGLTPGGTLSSLVQGAEYELIAGVFNGSWSLPDAVLVSVLVLAGSGPAPAAVVQIVGIGGQSNGEGTGLVSALSANPINTLSGPLPTRQFQRVRIYNPATDALEPLQAGVNNLGAFYTNNDPSRYGLEIGFAQAWEAENPTGELVIVKYALSSQAISHFEKPSGVGYTKTKEYFERAKFRLDGENKGYAVRGYLWKQGEAESGDATSTLANGYQVKLTEFFANLIADGVLQSDTKLFIGEVGLIGRVYESIVRGAQRAFVAGRTATARLGVTDQYPLPDSLHFSSVANFCDGLSFAYNAVYGTTRTYPFPIDGRLRVLQPGEQRADAGSTLWFAGEGTTWNVAGNDFPSSTGGFAFTQQAGFRGISFNGTGISFDLARYTGLASSVALYIDDVFQANVDIPSGADESVTERFVVNGLSAGVHTLKVVVGVNYAGQSLYGIVDRIRVRGVFVAYAGGANNPATTPPPVTPPLVVEDNNANKFESGAWEDLSTGLDSGTGSRRLQGADGFWGLSFTGTYLELHTFQSTTLVKYDVYLDNTYRGTVTTQGANEASAKRFEILGLSAGVHNLKIVGRSLYGAAAIVDKLVIGAGEVVTYAGGSVYPQLSEIENTNPSIVYGLGWTEFEVAGASSGNSNPGTLHFKNSNPGDAVSSATIGFVGENLSYWLPKWDFPVLVDLYVDGIFKLQVSVPRATGANEPSSVVGIITGLTAGSHTLRVDSVPGAMSAFDKISTQ